MLACTLLYQPCPAANDKYVDAISCTMKVQVAAAAGRSKSRHSMRSPRSWAIRHSMVPMPPLFPALLCAEATKVATRDPMTTFLFENMTGDCPGLYAKSVRIDAAMNAEDVSQLHSPSNPSHCHQHCQMLERSGRRSYGREV